MSTEATPELDALGRVAEEMIRMVGDLERDVREKRLGSMMQVMLDGTAASRATGAMTRAEELALARMAIMAVMLAAESDQRLLRVQR